MKLTKTDLLNLLAFAGLLVFFYPDLAVAKQASLMGDHWEQHYPWAFLMVQSLRQGVWPFWTPLIQCGFPIVAESQMGLFYPPNLFFYAILPLKWAYAYMNLFHFYVAAIGTYLYARKIGINPVGAFVAGIVFVFGTGYGGAYYNLTSLKTLAWFPWILFVFESFLAGRRFVHGAILAFLLALSILAGYMQVAFLAIAMIGFYAFVRAFIFPPEGIRASNKMNRRHPREGGDPQNGFPTKAFGNDISLETLSLRSRIAAVVGMFGVVLISFLLASPQLLLTFELAQFSNRVNLSESYAYVGSLSPATLLTIIFPILQGVFRGSCLYSGIFGIVFVVASFFVVSKELRKILWLWVTFSIVSLLLALGQWSPLYVALIKLTHFYSFRIPAKFLIFFCFGFAMLAGLGVHAIREDLSRDPSKKTIFSNYCLKVFLAIFTLWGFSYLCLTLGRSYLIAAGKWGIENFINGKPGHPRSFESYLETLSGSIDGARRMLSIANPWQVWAVVLILLSCAWLILFRRGFRPILLLRGAIIILLADLYVFASADIKRDFDDYQNVLKPNTVTQVLVREKEAGRLGRLYGYHKEAESLPLIPSVNMLYGIEDIGGYSPLIMRRYYETIGRFGNVNDSNSITPVTVPFVQERLPLLNALDVSHVLSTEVLETPDLRLILHDLSSQTYLYENLGDHQRGYFVSGIVQFAPWARLKERLMSPGFDPKKALLFEDSEREKLKDAFRPGAASKALSIVREHPFENSEHWTIETTGPGFFVLTNTMYPGWRARLDGREVPLMRAYGLFQAVYVPKAGKHSIEFSYSPFRALGWKFKTKFPFLKMLRNRFGSEVKIEN